MGLRGVAGTCLSLNTACSHPCRLCRQACSPVQQPAAVRQHLCGPHTPPPRPLPAAFEIVLDAMQKEAASRKCKIVAVDRGGRLLTRASRRTTACSASAPTASSLPSRPCAATTAAPSGPSAWPRTLNKREAPPPHHRRRGVQVVNASPQRTQRCARLGGAPRSGGSSPLYHHAAVRYAGWPALHLFDHALLTRGPPHVPRGLCCFTPGRCTREDCPAGPWPPLPVNPDWPLGRRDPRTPSSLT